MIEFLVEYRDAITIWMLIGTLFGAFILPLLLQEYPNDIRDWTIRNLIFGVLAGTIFLGAVLLYSALYRVFVVGAWIHVRMNYPESRLYKFLQHKPFQRRIK